MDQRRRVRFEVLPPALRAAVARNCALVLHCDEIDEARYDVFEVRREDDGAVVVSRRCWWFDEEVEQWLLDDSSDWYLSAEHAMQLGIAIHQAGVPVIQQRSSG